MDAEHCVTPDDVMVHLVSHLQWIYEDVVVGDWQQRFGFRRSLTTSQVWHNRKTGQWGFHVSNDAFTGVPNIYVSDTFTTLLEEVVSFYVKAWRL